MIVDIIIAYVFWGFIGCFGSALIALSVELWPVKAYEKKSKELSDSYAARVKDMLDDDEY